MNRPCRICRVRDATHTARGGPDGPVVCGDCRLDMPVEIVGRGDVSDLPEPDCDFPSGRRQRDIGGDYTWVIVGLLIALLALVGSGRL